MKTYLLLYKAPAAFMATAMKKAKPKERSESMKEWMAWKKHCGKSLKDMGAPLGGAFAVNNKGKAASNTNIFGYSVISAKDKTAVKKLIKNHPHTSWSSKCSIEVHEMMPMPK